MKINMFCNVETPSVQTNTPIAIMRRAIPKEPKEDTRSRPEGQFMTLIRMNMRKAQTPKRPQKAIIRRHFKQNFIRRMLGIDRGRQTINKIDTCFKSILPIFKRKTSMSKESKPPIYNLSVSPFHTSHLMMSVRTGEAVHNARS